MNAIIITCYEDFNDGEVEVIRQQDVITDDWDLMMFVPADKLEVGGTQEYPEYHHSNYTIDRMVTGNNYDSKWYPLINFRGQQWTLGVRHH